MDFTEWADHTGAKPRSVNIEDWMISHPEIARQVIDAHHTGWATATISRWLRDAAQAPVAESSLRRWLKLNA